MNRERERTLASLPSDEFGIFDLIEGALDGDTHWIRSVLRTARDWLQFGVFILFWIPMIMRLAEPPDWPLLGNLNPINFQLTYFAIVILFSFLSFYILLRIVYLRQRDRATRELVEAVNRQLISLSRELAIGKKPIAEALYGGLVRAYKNLDNEKAVVALAEASGTPIQAVETIEIGRHFRAGAETATEYLCVINASPTNKLLGDLRTIFDYFSRFDRKTYPRDRITRVFSLQINTMPSDDRPRATLLDEWTPEKRELLFSALWINKCCGVDTKLHLYTASKWNDFFEGADYVLCYDPAAEPGRAKRIVFHAVRGDEQQCLKIEGLPWLYDLFHFEFYKRLTGGHGLARDSDMIIDFTRSKWQVIREVIGLPEALGDSEHDALTKAFNSHEDWQKRLNSWPFDRVTS